MTASGNLQNKKKSILITGGAGFIGSEFVRQICNHGNYKRIFILDSLTYAGNLNRIEECLELQEVEFLHANVNEVSKYQDVLKEVSYIVHFAAESHVDRSNVDGFPFLESNVLGTYKLLEAARKHTSIRSLLVSTDEVYGPVLDGEADENFPLRPSSAYSASKTASDLFGLAAYHTFKQDLIVTRGCNTYGPFQHFEKMIPTVISNLIKEENVPIYGQGTNIREWIHASDHAAAIGQILHNGQSGEVYNIGSGYRLSNLELVNMIIDLLKPVSPKLDFVADRPGHDFRYALNSSKVSKRLNWLPKIDFEVGLSETIQWYKLNPAYL